MSQPPEPTTARAHRDRGAVIPLIAVALPVLILMVAFAVDLGIQRSNRRTMQARADIIALDLGRLANGRTLYEIMNDSDPSYLNAVQGSADRNEVPVSALTVEFGTWDGAAFMPLFVGINDNDAPTAVHVTARQSQDYFFQPGTGHVTRDAIALNGWAGPPPSCATPPCTPPPPPPPGPCTTGPCSAVFGDAVVDLTVGSIGAAFQPSVPDSVGLDATVEALNARLAAQLGASLPPAPGDVDAYLLAYRGLADASVDLYRVAAFTGRFATPNELLAADDLTVGELIDASVLALNEQGDSDAAAALEFLQTDMAVNNALTMTLGDSVSFESGGDNGAALGSVNALDLFSFAAEVINGQNFVDYTFSSGVPNVTIVDVDQYLVSPATKKLGLSLNGIADNKQMRFQIVLQIAPLAGLTAPVRIPLVVEAASARGTVTGLGCTEPRENSGVDIHVDTTLGSVQLGTAADLSANTLVVNQAVLLDGGAFSVSALLSLGLTPGQALGYALSGQTTADAYAPLGGGSSDHTFYPFQDPNPFQRSYGGLTGSLGATLQTDFDASLGNTLLPAAAQTNLRNQLDYLFDNIETSIIGPLLESSGVTIGGADVLADNLQCTGAGVIIVS